MTTSPTLGRPRTLPTDEVARFMHYVAPPNEHGCMRWTGALNNIRQGVFVGAVNPQGQIGAMSARVYVWWKLHGALPPGRLTTTCKDPLCLTPAHLAPYEAKAAATVKAQQHAAWERIMASEELLRAFMADTGSTVHVAPEYGLSEKQVQLMRGERGRARLAEFDSGILT